MTQMWQTISLYAGVWNSWPGQNEIYVKRYVQDDKENNVNIETLVGCVQLSLAVLFQFTDMHITQIGAKSVFFSPVVHS